jgi:type IV pilus assembly protein PilC
MLQLSFRQKEQLFHELEQLSRAGIPFSQALKTVGRNTRSALGRSADKLREAWEQTGSASQAFVAAGFEASDASLVEAGAESGRLEEIFAELGKSYGLKAASRQAMIQKSYYPLFVFHAGALISAVLPAFLANSAAVFFWNVIPVLGGFYLCVALAIGLRSFITRLLKTDVKVARSVQHIPFLGSFFSDWTGWNFALVLSLYLKAGGGILQAFRAAGLSCGNAALREQAEKTIAEVKNGNDLTDAFGRQTSAPEPLVRAIEIGEQTGRLDTEAFRAATICEDRALRRLGQLTEWLPRLFYGLIMIFMLYQIMKTFSEVGSIYNSIMPDAS